MIDPKTGGIYPQCRACYLWDAADDYRREGDTGLADRCDELAAKYDDAAGLIFYCENPAKHKRKENPARQPKPREREGGGVVG